MEVADGLAVAVVDGAAGRHFSNEFFIEDDVCPRDVDDGEYGAKNDANDGGRKDDASGPAGEEWPALGFTVGVTKWEGGYFPS